MRRYGLLVGCSLTLFVAGCSDEPVVTPREEFGTAEAWIINGDLDFEHDAVVALFSQQSGCTGTIIRVDGSSAYILTAAHCFGFGPIQQAAVGHDYTQAEDVLNVVEYAIHPSYNDQNVDFDFAMLRATGADPGTPVIPALTPPEDNLSVGTQVIHVGYGLISYPNGNTTRRHRADGNLGQIETYQIAYAQPNAGPCSGDSGGPNIVETLSGKRVAGVVSFGDQQCNEFGVSGRTSSVYDNFIAPFMNVEPSTSAQAATTTTTTTTGSGAGGAGAATSASSNASSGSGNNGNGWSNGNPPDQYDGFIVESGCSVTSEPPSPAEGAWRWLLLAAAALILRHGVSVAQKRKPR